MNPLIGIGLRPPHYDEIRQTLPGVGWLEARAISYGQSIPYFPWRTLGRQIVGAGEMDEDDEGED